MRSAVRLAVRLAVRRAARFEYCVVFALDEETMDLLLLGLDCAPVP